MLIEEFKQIESEWKIVRQLLSATARQEHRHLKNLQCESQQSALQVLDLRKQHSQQ
jgi:hypothetical protein